VLRTSWVGLDLTDTGIEFIKLVYKIANLIDVYMLSLYW